MTNKTNIDQCCSNCAITTYIVYRFKEEPSLKEVLEHAIIHNIGNFTRYELSNLTIENNSGRWDVRLKLENRPLNETIISK